jgi:hypothetical protein
MLVIALLDVANHVIRARRDRRPHNPGDHRHGSRDSFRVTRVSLQQQDHAD